MEMIETIFWLGFIITSIYTLTIVILFLNTRKLEDFLLFMIVWLIDGMYIYLWRLMV